MSLDPDQPTAKIRTILRIASHC